MADGPTRISGYLDSADTRATLGAVTSVGAAVSEGEPDGHGGIYVEVQGAGLRGAAPARIDVGNAGTLLRIMPGWLAGQPRGEWILDGDDSIRRRPVDRVVDPLRMMGGEVDCRDGRWPPLEVRGAPLRGIAYEPPIASAQVKSCLLLAGLLAEGETTVREPLRTRDHTERMLAAAGARIRRRGEELTVSPAERLESGDISVPGDYSSAAFFIAAALIVPGSELTLREVGINGTRIGLLPVLARMGVEMGGAHAEQRASMTVNEISEPGPEPQATLHIRSSALTGTTVSGKRSQLRSTSFRSSPCSAASPSERRSSAAPRSSATRSRTGSAVLSRGSPVSGRRSRPGPTGSPSGGPVGCAAGARRPR